MERYENVFDFSNVTVEDCEIMYKCKNECAILNDGLLIGFKKEEREAII